MRPTSYQPFHYSQIFIRNYNKQATTSATEYEIGAIDTETCIGYARLICDADGDHVLPTCAEDALAFICQRKNRGRHLFTYNLRFDAEAILKWLPREVLVTLNERGRVKYKAWSLKYIPKKKLTISAHKHAITLYDVAQFFQGSGVNSGSSLDAVAEKYLGQRKIGEDLDKDLMNRDEMYFRLNLEKIIPYCIQDARLTAELGVFLDGQVRRILEMPPKTYVSKAALSKQWFRSRCSFPLVHDIDPRASAAAHNAYYGGRFETMVAGTMDRCSLIDICSAYPFAIASLPDLRRGEWRRVTDATGKADVAFYLCNIDIPPFRQIAPFPFRRRAGQIIYPTGSFTNWITGLEFEAYADTCKIEVVSGYEWVADEIVFPFREAIHRLYHEKEITPKDDFRYSLTKIIMNSLYGSFYEKYKTERGLTAGVLFNPVYAAYITAAARVQLWQKAAELGPRVRAFATDSILLDGVYEGAIGSGLGEWSLDGRGKTTILKSGIYEMAGKAKTRGMQRGTRLNSPEGMFDTIFDYIRAFPDRTEYVTLETRPRHLGECLNHSNILSVEDINTWQTSQKVYRVADWTKREWLKTDIAGRDILSGAIPSWPWHILEDRIGSPMHLDEWEEYSVLV